MRGRGRGTPVPVRPYDTGAGWQAYASSETDPLPELRARATVSAGPAMPWRPRAPTAHQW